MYEGGPDMSLALGIQMSHQSFKEDMQRTLKELADRGFTVVDAIGIRRLPYI